MGGKRILWNIGPSKEADYNEYIFLLDHYGALKPNEWIDLSKLETSLLKDYLSASLWQIYNYVTHYIN
ncbi:hypothetical protein [Candidatus Palibaumannia cicadellinicola]|uniref:hypothetical protein n=1 Tax=Candidatus Palibaumannia cicadellinicola TaxID=186490 RepID=UPI0002F77ED6|nr:hypothetical protein [Candidatus Baumannia cicadellinicola]MCJ7462424.1 hypothetical protein [Candidatus Baumannia cicadellinicola]MCJ7463044.1 hypothetical protein [Candidatus Baumannia cicadellinicola]